MVSFLQVFLPEFCMHFFSVLYILHILPISSSLFVHFNNMSRGDKHEVPCAISSSLLLSLSSFLICSCNIYVQMLFQTYFLVNNFCLIYLPVL